MTGCDKCNHKGICKNEENMEKLVKTCKEALKIDGFEEFSVEVKCKHFYETCITKRNI